MANSTTGRNPKMVTGLFNDRDSAERAYSAVSERGYNKDDVNLVMSDDTRARYFSGDDAGNTDLGSKAAEGAGIGAGIGGTLGAVVAAVAAVGTSVALPGLGLVIAGPIAAAIAGAGAGGVTGGLLGALIGSGIPEDRVKRYEEGIQRGGILMGVTPRSDEDASHFEEKWKNSNGEHVIGTGLGATAGGMAGKGTASVVNPTAEDGYWRESYSREPYYAAGQSYDDYAPAYSLGYNGRNRYNSDFESAESQLASDWNTTKGTSKLSWDQAKHATRAAWHRAERAMPGNADRDGR